MSGGGPSPAAPALLWEECGEHGSWSVCLFHHAPWGRSVGSMAHGIGGGVWGARLTECLLHHAPWGRSVGSSAQRVSVCFYAAHLCSARSCPVWWQPNLGTGKRAPSSTACKCEPGCWCPGGTCTEDRAPAGRPGVRDCACKVMSRLALSYFKPQWSVLLVCCC